MSSKNRIWIFLLATLLASCNGYVTDPAQLCANMGAIDCALQYYEAGDETVCTSDGQTFENKCFYVQAKCLHPSLTIVHLGPCSVSPEEGAAKTNLSLLEPATQLPTEENQTWKTIEENACEMLISKSCDSTLDPVCGTDGKFYLNM